MEVLHSVAFGGRGGSKVTSPSSTSKCSNLYRPIAAPSGIAARRMVPVSCSSGSDEYRGVVGFVKMSNPYPPPPKNEFAVFSIFHPVPRGFQFSPAACRRAPPRPTKWNTQNFGPAVDTPGAGQKPLDASKRVQTPRASIDVTSCHGNGGLIGQQRAALAGATVEQDAGCHAGHAE